MASCGYRALADFPEAVHTINLLPEAVRVLLHSPYSLKPVTLQSALNSFYLLMFTVYPSKNLKLSSVKFMNCKSQHFD